MDKVYQEVAKHLNLNEEDVKEAYEIYWEFIRDKIESLPLKEDLTEEEFSKLRTSVNIPSLGKIGCSYQRYLNIKKRYKYIQDAKVKKSKATT